MPKFWTNFGRHDICEKHKASQATNFFSASSNSRGSLGEITWALAIDSLSSLIRYLYNLIWFANSVSTLTLIWGSFFCGKSPALAQMFSFQDLALLNWPKGINVFKLLFRLRQTNKSENTKIGKIKKYRKSTKWERLYILGGQFLYLNLKYKQITSLKRRKPPNTHRQTHKNAQEYR